MSLTRTEYAHAKYPWEYTTGELLDLFEIVRESQLLSAGNWHGSGIIESIKMLEQQLRFLSVFAFKRIEKFSGYEGEIAFLYSSNIVPTLAVQNITYNGNTVSHIMDWIDNLRADYGLSAWSWSNTGKTLFNIGLIKELWYATGLLHANIDFDENKRSVYYFEPPAGGYVFDFGYAMPYNAYLYTYPTILGRAQRIFAFSEDTRTVDTKTLLLFAAYSDAWYFSGDMNVNVYKISSVSDAETVYKDNLTPVTDSYRGSNTPTTGTGAGCTWKAFDITLYHPQAGTTYCYYKAAMEETAPDIATMVNPVTLAAAITPIYLWQTVTSNPYS